MNQVANLLGAALSQTDLEQMIENVGRCRVQCVSALEGNRGERIGRALERQQVDMDLAHLNPRRHHFRVDRERLLEFGHGRVRVPPI
ncbi:MAG: hypothetical protein ACREL7_19695 [Longimicrobiales bacterium]